MRLKTSVFAALAFVVPHLATAAPIIFSGAGIDAAAIQGVVTAFRNELGTLNPNVAGSFGSGRREINWDGVPDAVSAPNNLPANFFNANSPRGVVLETPGTGFQVSATAASGTPIEFGNIDPSYPNFFTTFSAERLFTALGSTITDVRFFIPGSSTPALTNGFGAVFTDVDLAGTTSLAFFDASDQLIQTFGVMNIPGDQTLSFLGVKFSEGAIVSRVRITSGNQVLAPGTLALDSVVMDDFIYGEPVAATAAVPEPATLTLVGTGIAACWMKRRRTGSPAIDA